MASIRDVTQAARVRPVDVGRSVGGAAQTAMTLRDLASRQQAAESQARLRALPLPTDRAGRQEYTAAVAREDPGMAIDFMKEFRAMDAAELEQHRAEAPFYSAALQGVTDQASLDAARESLAGRGLDVSDFPTTYNQGQINLARQGYGMLAGAKPGEGQKVLGAKDVLVGPGGEEIARGLGRGAGGGPFEGKSMDAQTYNILLSGDPASPEYRAAYIHQAQPRMAFDPVTGRMAAITPDMSAFRVPADMAAKPQGQAEMGPGPGVAVEEAAPAKLSLAESQALASFDQADTDLASAEALFFPEGRFDRKLAAAAQANLPGSDGRTARQQMRRTIEVLLRLRTGAAAPETEVQSYLDQFMPSPFDTQTQAKAKLDAAKTFFAGTGDLFRESRNLPAQGAAAPDEPAADFGGMSNEQFLSVPLTEDNAEAWMEEVERRGLQ